MTWEKLWFFRNRLGELIQWHVSKRVSGSSTQNCARGSWTWPSPASSRPRMLSSSRASRLPLSGCDRGPSVGSCSGGSQARKRQQAKTRWRRKHDSGGDSPEPPLRAPEGRTKCSSQGKTLGFGCFMLPSFKESSFRPKAAMGVMPLLPGDCWTFGVPTCCSLRALALCPPPPSVCMGIGCYRVAELPV